MITEWHTDRRAKSTHVTDTIRDLISIADEEFVPPLSARTSTIQQNLKNAEGEDTFDYFMEVLRGRVLLAWEDGKVIGFMSLRPNHVLTPPDGKALRTIYITTMIVHPDHRGKGISYRFYEYLINHSTQPITTRTWSTHPVHNEVLQKAGFEEWWRIPDDRGPGVDTVYWKHEREVEETK